MFVGETRSASLLRSLLGAHQALPLPFPSSSSRLLPQFAKHSNRPLREWQSLRNHFRHPALVVRDGVFML